MLGGFSQGAMVATDVTLASPNDVDGLVIWSGTLLDEAGWTKRAKDMEGRRFFQSHGGGDPVLPYALAQRLHDVLKTGGAQGQLMGFGGGHDIPVNVLRATAEFTKSVFA